MRGLFLSLLGLFATSAVAGQHDSKQGALLRKLHGDKIADFVGNLEQVKAMNAPGIEARDGKKESEHFFLNDKTKPFAVDGANIPNVKGNAGESYAGLLPISDKKGEQSHHYFWFWPSDNAENRKKKEIAIWLNGGPGCSSLMGFLQENGPFVWRPGTEAPVMNPWSWHHLTNIVWVEQPVSVGFSTGKVTIHNEDELAEQFMGFWKNFIETFSMQGYKIYLIAESYGGIYGPFIGSHFLDAKNTKYYDLQGLMVVDGLSFNSDLQSEAITEAFLEQNHNLMPLTDDIMSQIRNMSRACGYSDYVKKYWTYPPSGPQPDILPWQHAFPNGTVVYKDGCGYLWESVVRLSIANNPCFSIYNIQAYCPSLYDPVQGDKPWFDRQDVKKAIHAPLNVKWVECTDTPFVGGVDQTTRADLYELPNVIDKTKNVIYVQGGMDFILPPHGVLLAVQNMTWGGERGFHSQPTDPFYAPRWGWPDDGHYYGITLPDKSGVVGTTHTERGLTVVVAGLAGHEGPQYSSIAAIRQLEKLLGRVKSLSDTVPLTIPQVKHAEQDPKPLGKGTYPIPFLGRH